MRKYEVIWEQIKKASSEAERWVEVQASTVAYMQTIINMVQLEKSRASVARRSLDLPSFGRLEIVRKPDDRKVLFRLKDSGAAL